MADEGRIGERHDEEGSEEEEHTGRPVPVHCAMCAYMLVNLHLGNTWCSARALYAEGKIVPCPQSLIRSRTGPRFAV
jgi:hypothetical protein